MAVVFRDPCPFDVDELAERMRPIDILECYYMTNGMDALSALTLSVSQSSWVKVAHVDDELACMFGVVPQSMLGETGIPWMLATEGFEKNARPFLIHAPHMVARMHQDYERLTNYVHAYNHKSIRFLGWCGFRFGQTIDLGGEPFREFSRVSRMH